MTKRLHPETVFFQVFKSSLICLHVLKSSWRPYIVLNYLEAKYQASEIFCPIIIRIFFFYIECSKNANLKMFIFLKFILYLVPQNVLLMQMGSSLMFPAHCLEH